MISLGRIGRTVGSLLLVGSLSVFGLMNSGGSAEAATCGTSGGLDTTDIKIVLGGMDVFATDCDGINSGNDTGAGGTLISDLNAGMFTGLVDDWSLFGKSDDVPNTGVIAQELTSGTFSIDFTPNAYSVFAASFKSATGYVVYLFDLRPDLVQSVNGMFTLKLENRGGNIAALSHLSVATWGDPTDCPQFPFCDPVTDVPVPASLPLLAAGMGIVGVLARRRKRFTA